MPSDIYEYFDEIAFPPCNLNSYQRSVNAGMHRASSLSAVIISVARDVEDICYATSRRIERLGRLFKDYRVCVYANDCIDATEQVLIDWKKTNYRVKVYYEDIGTPRWPSVRSTERGEHMAAYRNKARMLALENASDFDAWIVVDFDLLGGWSYQGIAHTLSYWGEFDAMASNGLYLKREHDVYKWMQFDAWAYRDLNWKPRTSFYVRRLVPVRGGRLVPLLSAFGGLAVYSREAFKACKYAGDGDTEHVTFHRHLNLAGYRRLFLNPSQITVYNTSSPFCSDY